MPRTPPAVPAKPTRSSDSSETRPTATPRSNKVADSAAKERGARPQRVPNEGDSRHERGGGLSQGERKSQRNPDSSRTATNTGGTPTGKTRR